jgi:hypothetical protein
VRRFERCGAVSRRSGTSSTERASAAAPTTLLSSRRDLPGGRLLGPSRSAGGHRLRPVRAALSGRVHPRRARPGSWGQRRLTQDQAAGQARADVAALASSSTTAVAQRAAQQALGAPAGDEREPRHVAHVAPGLDARRIGVSQRGARDAKAQRAASVRRERDRVPGAAARGGRVCRGGGDRWFRSRWQRRRCDVARGRAPRRVASASTIAARPSR